MAAIVRILLASMPLKWSASSSQPNKSKVVLYKAVRVVKIDVHK